MEETSHCVLHRRKPVEYVCPACDNLRMCEECKLVHVNEEGHEPENCKEVGQRLMNQRIQDAGGRQTKELAKGLREGQKELGAEIIREIDKFRSSLVQTEEQSKMRKLDSEGKYAELYFYAKSLPAVGANNEAATEELNKRLLEVLDTTYEGLQKARNKIAAGAGETLAERIAKMEEERRRQAEILQNSERERKRLEEILQNSERERKRPEEILQNSENDRERLAETLQKREDELKSYLPECDARGFKESTAEIDKQSELQKKKNLIQKLGDRLNTVENELNSAQAKFNAQFKVNAAEVSEFRRILDAKAEDVNKRIAEEEEEKKKPLSVEKVECALSQRLAERLLAEYTGYEAYARAKETYEKLVSNSKSDPVLRTVMLIYYYRSFAHPCGLDNVYLGICTVGDKGATIIACGLKLSTKVNTLDLRKQTPARL